MIDDKHIKLGSERYQRSYPIPNIMDHTDSNTHYQYRFPLDHQPPATCCRTVRARHSKQSALL